MTHVDDYQTYRNLPPLAGLCSMKRAVESQWSLEESVTRLKRIHHVFRRVHESLIARIPGEPIYELNRAIMSAFYIFILCVSVVIQGCGALYYFTRRRHVVAYLRNTPEWVIGMLRIVAE